MVNLLDLVVTSIVLHPFELFPCQQLHLHDLSSIHAKLPVQHQNLILHTCLFTSASGATPTLPFHRDTCDVGQLSKNLRVELQSSVGVRRKFKNVYSGQPRLGHVIKQMPLPCEI
jgi:hypothetical protein